MVTETYKKGLRVEENESYGRYFHHRFPAHRTGMKKAPYILIWSTQDLGSIKLNGIESFVSSNLLSSLI